MFVYVKKLDEKILHRIVIYHDNLFKLDQSVHTEHLMMSWLT